MKDSTSWQKIGDWYKKVVGQKGHFYHQAVILPGLLRLMNLKGGEKILDLGCGQGVLARSLPNKVEYTGVDLASNLIAEARKLDKNLDHKYIVGDISKALVLKEKFEVIVIVLALQNVQQPFKVFENAKKYLQEKGRILVVLNHPCFRIPKQSDWGIDREKMVQYRKINQYMSPIKIPIESSPFDQKNNQISWSFHYPLSAYSEMIFDNGMVIEKIEEWVSPKKSEGGMAKVEDKARREIPMFMTIVCRK